MSWTSRRERYPLAFDPDSASETNLAESIRFRASPKIRTQSAFTGAAGYDANAALAIPNAELARLGVSHSAVTGAQMTGYRAFARTGAVLTWDAVSTIETNALIRGGMAPEMAGATVTTAIDALKQAGVAGPTRIPWGR